jgi:hypothetical protein
VAKKPRAKPSPRRPSSRSGGGKRSPPPTVYKGTSKRVIDYLKKHPTATVAQARGHKPAEHKTRKERARAAGRLDENQRAAIKRYAKITAPLNDGGPDPDELYQAMLAEFDGPGGWERFQQAKRGADHHAKLKRHRHRVRRHDKAGKLVTLEMEPYQRVWPGMEAFAAELGIPVEWIYYHR